MGLDRDPADVNPYASQSTANTQVSWAGNGLPVDVDLDGIREYAKQMAGQQTDLATRGAHLTPLSAMPAEAWEGDVLGEGAFVREQFAANAAELSAYLQNLAQTMANISSAAQTVADIYQSADATGAASLNDVLFAYGDSGARRPDGLPARVGRTYVEALMEGAATDPAAATGAPPPATQISPYQSSQTFAMPNRQRREVVTTTVPGSNLSTVTTTVYDRDGTVLSTGSTRTTDVFDPTTNTRMTTVDSYRGGEKTGSTTTATAYDGDEVLASESVTTDRDGTVTGREKEEVDPAGARTGTTVRVDADGREQVTDRVTVGPQTHDGDQLRTPVADRYTPPTTGNG